MSLLFPTLAMKSFNDIKISDLNKMNITAIFLDMDNTLSIPKTFEPISGIEETLKTLKLNGIKCIIISNNYKKNVKPLADKLGLPFVSMSMKPFGRGFVIAKKILGEKYKNILVVGDQVFTDVIGANLFGMKSILLDPVTLDEPTTVRFKRKIEDMVRKKVKNVEMGKCS